MFAAYLAYIGYCVGFIHVGKAVRLDPDHDVWAYFDPFLATGVMIGAANARFALIMLRKWCRYMLEDAKKPAE